MKKKSNQKAAAAIAVRLWTHAEAVKAVPYLRAVVRSIREYWLAMRGAQLQAQRIDARSGRPDRNGRFLREQVAWEAGIAQERFEEAMDELMTLDVYSVDPARGFAQIPFAHGKELAWYIFDLFSASGIVAWRFETDSAETRRPLDTKSEPSELPQLRAADVDVLMSQG
jgi:hypothetical protein